MICKKNRLYFNEREILKIIDFYDYEMENIDGRASLNDFLKNIELVYKSFKYQWEIRKPNLKYIMIYIKLCVYEIKDNSYQKDIFNLCKYRDLYRNDKI